MKKITMLILVWVLGCSVAHATDIVCTGGVTAIYEVPSARLDSSTCFVVPGVGSQRDVKEMGLAQNTLPWSEQRSDLNLFFAPVEGKPDVPLPGMLSILGIALFGLGAAKSRKA
jgi:hypothetical protein